MTKVTTLLKIIDLTFQLNLMLMNELQNVFLWLTQCRKNNIFENTLFALFFKKVSLYNFQYLNSDISLNNLFIFFDWWNEMYFRLFVWEIIWNEILSTLLKYL